jgi:Fe-S cluster assembly iron-binding protein IscA
LEGEPGMIVITERAKKELKKILTDNVDHPEARLRLRINDQGQLGLGIDIEMPDDKIIEYEGSKLLLVERELADSLEDIAIDVEDSDEGSQLVIIDKYE